MRIGVSLPVRELQNDIGAIKAVEGKYKLTSLAICWARCRSTRAAR